MRLRDTNFFDFESKNKLTKKTLLVLVMFLCVFAADFICLQFSVLIAGIIYAIKDPTVFSDPFAILATDSFMVFSLFVTVFAIILSIVYVRFIEKRPLKTMGFVKKGALKQYGMGYLIGIVMIAIPALSLLAFNGKIYFNADTNYAILLLFFAGFLIQGASEEIMIRGYLFTSLLKTTNKFWAITISSFVFALMHMGNSAMGILPFVNLMLFAIFACFFFMRTKNIWAISAIHSAWNFFQGNIFGIEVSGQVMNTSLFNIKSACPDLLGGGDFGLEGGLIVTVVLVVATVITVFAGKNNLIDTTPNDEKNAEVVEEA